MLCGKPPLAAAAGVGLVVGPLGCRALFSIPIGVEDEVIEAAESSSEMGRREGIRGIFGSSAAGLNASDSSSEPGDAGIDAKSTESPGALGGASYGGVAIDEGFEVSIWGA